MYLPTWFADQLDANKNFRACRAIELMSGDPPGGWRNPFQAEWAPEDTVAMYDAIGGGLRWAYVRDGYNVIVFIRGITERSQGKLIADEWTLDDRFAPPYFVSRAYKNIADVMFPSNLNLLFQGASRVRIFGHSSGGCVGQLLAARLLAETTITDVECTSYGSPKPGSLAFAHRMRSVRNVRFDAAGDYVPAMPPNPSEAPGFTLFAFGAFSWTRLSSWVHPLRGWQLENDGSYFNREVPIVPPNAFSSYLDIAIMGQASGFWAPHAIANYKGLFLKRLQDGIGFIPPAPYQQPEQPTHINSTERTRIARSGEQAIVADVRSATSVIRNTTLTPINASDPTTYVGRPLEGTWYVTRGQAIVDVGPGKRKAKSLARAFNRAAKRQ